MKKLIALSLLLLLSAQSDAVYAQENAAQQAAPAPETRAREIVSWMAAGQFEKVEALFDSAVAAALPAGKLGESWKSLIVQVGAFKRVTGAKVKTVQGLQVVTLTTAFESAVLDGNMVFHPDGKLAGLHFGLHKDDVEWMAPGYATPTSFHETSLTVTSGRWQLPGTLTLPNGDGPFPAVVLVHGSGPNDADETIGPNKPFKDLAWGLASRGVGVLRYVKRSRQYGADSTDDVSKFTVNQETIDDARAAIALAAANPKIDSKRVFLLGHSLGAFLAPRIASGEPKIAGLVMLAGSTRPLDQIIVEQVRYIVTQEHLPAETAKKKIQEAEGWARDMDRPDLKPGDQVEMLGTKIPGSYFLDLRGYDPAATAAKLTLPMLVLQGERDYQVLMVDFEGWKKALGGRKNVSFKSYPPLNHLFIAGTGPSVPKEYDRPGHVAEETIADIAAWIAGVNAGK
jgi:dienelactone hydrolase